MEWEQKDDLVGKQYDGYLVLSVVGSGTFGQVYKVRHQSTGQLYAMKHVLQNKKYKNRQLDIMKNIDSSFVVKLHNHFYKEESKGLYLNLIMEYLPDTLSRTIKSNLPYKKYLPTQLIIQYSRCLLTALADLHKAKICHRDIKPSNILLNQDIAKLCDFGSAKILTEGQKNISYICSRYYRAPELLLGAVFYTEQVDIWALGCVIAEMLTNHVLFEGTNSTAMLSKIIRTIGPPSREDLQAMQSEQEMQLVSVDAVGIRGRILKFKGDAPVELIEVVEKMVIYNPYKRIRAEEALKIPVFHH